MALSALALLATSPTALAVQHQLPGAVTLEWDATVNAETWGFEYPIAAASSPLGTVVAGGRVASPYFLIGLDGLTGQPFWRVDSNFEIGRGLTTSSDGKQVYGLSFDSSQPTDRQAIVTAYDGFTGTELWSTFFTSWTPGAMVQPASDLALSVSGAQLYVCGKELEFGSGLTSFATVAALSTADGQVQWLRRFPSPTPDPMGFSALDVASSGGLLALAGSSGSIANPVVLAVGLNANNGVSRWERLLAGGAVHDVAVDSAGTTVAVGVDRAQGGEDLFVLEGDNGVTRWTDVLGDRVIAFDFSSTGDSLFANSVGDQKFPGTEKNLLTTHSFDPGDGSKFWTRALSTPWGTPGSIDFEGGPFQRTLSYDATLNRVVVGASRGLPGGAEDIQVVAYSGATGLALWQRSIDVSPQQSDQSILAIATTATGRVDLVGDNAGELDLQGVRIQSLSTATGVELWKATLDEGSAAADTPVDLCVGVDGSQLFELNRVNLGVFQVSARSTATGTELWTVEFSTASQGFDSMLPQIRAELSGGAVVVHSPGANESRLIAFSTESGEIVWERAVADAIGAPNDRFALHLSLPGGSFSAAPDTIVQGINGLGELEISEFDPQGITDFTASIDIGGNSASVAGLASDAAGKIVVAAAVTRGGPGASSSYDENPVLVCYDAEQNSILWTRNYIWPSTYFDARDVALSPDGTRIALTAQLDSPQGPMATAVFAISDGAPIWVNETGPVPGGIQPCTARFAVDGEFLITASRRGFGSEADVQFDAVFAANGQAVWSRLLDGGAGDDLAEFVVTPDSLTLVGVGSRGLSDPVSDRSWSVGLDAPTGSLLFETHFDSPADGIPFFEDEGEAIALSQAGDAIFTSARTWAGANLSDGLVSRFLMPTLFGSPEVLSLASGGSQVLELRAPLTSGGDAYLVLGSATGTQPALPIDGIEVPLVIDTYTALTLLQPNSGPFVGTLGVLDSTGRGSAQIELPAGLAPTLAGLELRHAFIAVDIFGSWTIVFGSNAMPLTLTF